MNCKNCGTEVDLNFCPNCGQPSKLKRIDGKYILHEIEHVLHLERGFLYTIRELIVNPGENVRDYLSSNRSRLVKPIIFIIVTSLIYTISNHFFHFEDGYVQYIDEQESTTTKIFDWIRSHYGYGNIVVGTFIAFWIRLFFRKHEFNFFEILILLCFVMGVAMLIYTLFGILAGLVHANVMQLSSVAAFIYITWAIGQFYGKRKIGNYLKALFAYLLGMLTFSLAAVLLGNFIDLILKYAK